METFENYDSAWATGMDDPDGDPPFVKGLQDKVNVGVRFDAVRRVIPYQIGQYDTTTQTNSTGFTLWSSGNVIAPGGSYSARDQFNQSICIKSIDTGVVTFYDCYNSANLVPAGIGPTAKGTYTFISNPTAGQDIVLNGVTWTFVASGAAGNQTNIQGDTLSTVQQLSWDLNNSADSSLTPAYYTAGDTEPAGAALGIVYKTGGAGGNAYTLAAGSYGGDISGSTLAGGDTSSDGTWRRFVESFASDLGQDPMMVDPRTGNLWQHVDAFADADFCLIYLFRASDDFSLVISPLRPPPGQTSHMRLTGISDDWVYVTLVEETHAHYYTLTLTPRTITAQETTLDSLLVYAQYVYDPLWNDYYFRNVFNHATSMFTFGGAKSSSRAFKLYRFDEPSSAPFGGPTVGGGFADITPWGSSTGPNTDVTDYTVDGSSPPTRSTQKDNKYLLYYLPSTDDLVCITELWAGDTPTGWDDPALTRFDCTYVNVGEGTFDYHQAFVTGYMTAEWTTTVVAADAAWVVLGTYEVDLYLGQNTYDFSGLGKDYTKRWIYFEVQPVVSGSWSYDATTTHIIMVQYQFAYGTAPTVVQVVDEQGWDDAYTAYATAIGNSNVVAKSIGLKAQNENINNSGISDDANSVFIWDGYAEDSNLRHLGPVPSRQFYYNNSDATAPFLRLSFASSPPPSTAGSGFAYFIERMDSRIWPTIESAWCLDAALSNTMPTPAGTLSISSATGGANIGLYNIINGGSGYTAPIGQIVDLAGPGSGASVAFGVSGGVITSAVAATEGSGYLQPQLTVLDATGTGAVVQPIVTNYVTMSCSTASFSASNVGDIVRAGGGKIQVVTYGTTASTTTTVTGNIITPITATIPNDPNATPIPVVSGSWTMTTPTTSVRGLSHLEGYQVYALADGGVVPNLTVSNGAVTLPVSASQVLVGLQFTAQLQTMYLEAPGGGATVQTRRKDITQVVLRVDNSASPEVGTNQPDAAAQPNGATLPWTNMTFVPNRTPSVPAGQPVPLFSGDLAITNVFATWSTGGQIAVQQRDPVPLTLTALTPWVSIADTPSGS